MRASLAFVIVFLDSIFFFAHNDRAEREGGGVSVRRGRERAKEELSHSLVKVN